MEISITSKTKEGKTIEVIISKKEINKNINLDGDIFERPSEEILHIEMYLDGKKVLETNNKPKLITKESYGRHYESLKQKGAYAQLNDLFISEDVYTKLINGIEAINIKKKEKKQTDESYEKSRNNVLKAMSY